jgi:hypothetical protein
VKQSLVLAILTCSGCVTDSEPYPVAAVANLAAIGSEVTGPIEVLGVPSMAYERTLGAYHVHLPDQGPRRVMIFDIDVCDRDAALAPVGRGGAPHRPLADLQEIQRVRDETHFFARGINVEGRRVDIDTVTIQVPAPIVRDNPDNPFGSFVGKIAVVQELDHEDGSPGPWLACGVFVDTGAPQ